jgi:hypothetical protein
MRKRMRKHCMWLLFVFCLLWAGPVSAQVVKATVKINGMI